MRRALKESALYLNEFPVLAEAILKGPAWKRSGHARSLALLTLCQARGQAVQPIVEFYRDAPAEERQTLRAVLCRIGKEAQAAAPVLRAELKKPETSAEDKVAIKVVLAAMGRAAPAELDEIAAAISGCRESGLEVLSTMYDCGHNPWVPESVEKAIVNLLEKPRRNPDNLQQNIRDYACQVLTTFGDRTDTHVLKALEAEYSSVLRDSRCPTQIRFWAGLCLAKADPSRRRAMMLSLLMEVPGSLWAWQVRPLMEWTCAGMPNEDLLWVADALLSERKVERLEAALVILYAVGPRARSAVPRLVTLIRSVDDDFIRTEAAEVLGMLADPSDLTLLRNLSAEVASCDELREAVQESIRAVQLRD